MGSNIEHKKEFVQDTHNILSRINKILTTNEISIPRLYREVHSLKGAAGFAGLTNMEQLAHTLEDFLSNIRSGKLSLNEDIEKIFFYAQDFFVKDLELWKSQSKELDHRELLLSIESKTASEDPISIEVVEEKHESNSFFNDFESTLLQEAMYRGEQFYKIICHIDRDEEMKYPRLFLVVNNLEKISNVVKIEPTLEEITKNRSREITLYITTSKIKSEIYKGLNFDRIREVEFLRLDYNSFLNSSLLNDSPRDINLYGSTIDVETLKIEEIFNYAQDLHNKLLLEEFVIPEKRGVVKELLTGMKRTLTSLTTISFNRAFADFDGYCKKLGNELGKECEFIINGGELPIDRELGEILKELILQLVKNSIDHGLESSKERVGMGKNPIGRIILSVTSVKESLALTLEDDGRGIDQKALIKRGIDGNFIEKDEKISLLSLLCKPGFSTSKEVNHYSGRGVGLDLVVNRVINKLDGKIKVENNPGKGLQFHILIPPSSSVKRFTLFKYRNSSFGFSIVNVAKKITLENKNITIGDNSTLDYTYNNVIYPIYTPWGRLSSTNRELKQGYGLILRYLGKKAFIPVDEFILEKEFFSSVLTYVDTDTPNHKAISIGDKKEDFTIILPSIINS
ncbi:MAG: hypothetical protein B6229_02710 [Spirochaetaceae bacterium 4572_7]|nr:MAG: hypothetical protein B6229_02710 [Spirochaetaceae bacterium 4572_7]